MEEYNKAVEILESGYEKTEEKEFAKQVEIVKKIYIAEESKTDTKIRVQEETQESPVTEIIIETEESPATEIIIEAETEESPATDVIIEAETHENKQSGYMEKRIYDAYNNIKGSVSYSYDDDGQLVKEVEKDANGDIVSYTEWECSDSGYSGTKYNADGSYADTLYKQSMQDIILNVDYNIGRPILSPIPFQNGYVMMKIIYLNSEGYLVEYWQYS